jgi:hypothetical protein
MTISIRTHDGAPVTHRDATLLAQFSASSQALLVPSFTVKVTEESWLYDVHLDLDFAVQDGRFTVQGLSILMHEPVAGEQTDAASPVPEVNTTVLRSVRVNELLQRAAGGGIYVKFDRDAEPASLLEMFGPSGVPDYTKGVFKKLIVDAGPTAKTLGWVALTYQLAVITSQPPAKAVEAQFGLTVRTAVRWIAKAKELGLIDVPHVRKVGADG